MISVCEKCQTIRAGYFTIIFIQDFEINKHNFKYHPIDFISELLKLNPKKLENLFN